MRSSSLIAMDRQQSAARRLANINFKECIFTKIRNCLQVSALIGPYALQEAGRLDRPAVRHRETQVRDARIEIVHKARYSIAELDPIIAYDALGPFLRSHKVRSLISR